MKRSELQDLAISRIEEAKTLLANNHFNGAYYLAGYAMECGLKACLVQRINQHELPEKQFILDSYTHDLKRLLQLAMLDQEKKVLEKEDNDFLIKWSIANEWNEKCRYKFYTENDAKQLIDAIDPDNGGLLKWLQQYW